MTNLQGNSTTGGAAGGTSISISNAYKYYVVAIIWFVLLLRFVDLQILAVLLESIKVEFDFTDTQLGLLGGIAFSLFYGILGIPIAWLADRSNRRNIISVAIGIWSFMTALCGMATGFLTLFLARIGVGVGEAGGQPPSYSLISDYFPPDKRSTIFSILSSAVPVGVFVGFLVGGYVNEWFGWRAAFYVVGIPGVIVALMVRFTVKELPRGFSDEQQQETKLSTVKETLSYLMGNRSYWHIVIATTLFTLAAYGSGIWFPSFFIRIHGMTSSEIGTWAAFIYGGGGLVGAMLGGILADRFADKTGDKRWYMWVPAIATICILPFAFFTYLWSNPIQALLVHIGTTTLMHMFMGPAYGTIQSLAGTRRRAMAAAINQLFINLIALGLGPLIIGMASDYFGSKYGVASLRYSILTVVVVGYGWAAIHFYLASKTLREDLIKAETAD